MGNKRFNGKLINANPNSIISKTTDENFENFFLTLALIYNDLKGLIFFEKFIIQNYERPDGKTASAHNGEYGGLLLQVHRLFIGLIREFLKLIETSNEVLKSARFKNFMSGMSPEVQKHWRFLVDTAFNNNVKNFQFTNALERIRNNVSFHYWDSGKNLRKGFSERFFGKDKNQLNEFAFYSLEGSIDESRFYYADAAVEQFIFSISHQISKSKQAGSIVVDEEYRKKVREILIEISVTLHKILKKYLKNK